MIDIFSKTFSALNLFKSSTWIALKFALSILTLKAVVCLPNRVRPFTPKWADMWAGPVSLATTKELFLISVESCEILSALFWSKIEVAWIFFASLIKESSFVVANDTGPAHMSAHLGAKGITLFGKHTTAFKVSIERENFKAIQVYDLNKLSAEKVFERIFSILD